MRPAFSWPSVIGSRGRIESSPSMMWMLLWQKPAPLDPDQDLARAGLGHRDILDDQGLPIGVESCGAHDGLLSSVRAVQAA